MSSGVVRHGQFQTGVPYNLLNLLINTIHFFLKSLDYQNKPFFSTHYRHP
ncbi:hypothetical protein [Xanthomarina sp.]|nr:hypothetical protein [Xanthomarina sp.]HLV38026.1 hypothetical protein [Xanthomarina sp.]